MKATTATHKRRLHRNVYGNINGYIGRRHVMDFGLGELSAHEWLRDGCFVTQLGGSDLLATPRLDGSCACDYKPAPAGFKWVNPLPAGTRSTV